jgi:dTDP-glucose 4,6-dehydratase
MRYDIDPSFIEQKLGWKQSVSFEEGIQKTIDWYKVNEAWWQAYAKRFDLMRESGLYKQKAETSSEATS